MTALAKLSTEDLMAEIERREGAITPDHVLAAGIVGIEGGKPFVDVFKVIREEKDCNFVGMAMRLRARYNSHRKYQIFFFKTNDFDKLHTAFESDNEAFANWVYASRGSIKRINL